MENVIKQRIFISYTDINILNREWVETLASNLEQNGFDVHMEIPAYKSEQDFGHYLKNELIMADKVLLICDEYYIKKFSIKNIDIELECKIIQDDMMINTQKYIYIQREEKVNMELQIYQKSRYVFPFTEEMSENKFRELLFLLDDWDKEPILGAAPQDILDIFSSTFKFSELWETIYPYLDYIGTILGVIGGTIGFGKWLKGKFEHNHSPLELVSFVTDSSTWSSSKLASQLNITQEEAKNILKGFGYEWNRSDKVYSRTDRTYAIVNLLKESLKNK